MLGVAHSPVAPLWKETLILIKCMQIKHFGEAGGKLDPSINSRN